MQNILPDGRHLLLPVKRHYYFKTDISAHVINAASACRIIRIFFKVFQPAKV
jgi:hypothetical protein